MSIFDIFKINEIKHENAVLKKHIQDIGASDAIKVKEYLEKLKIELNEVKSQKHKLFTDVKTLKSLIKKKEAKILSLDESLLMESFGLYEPHFAFENSEVYKENLEKIRNKQKLMIKSGTAAKGSVDWTINGRKAEGQKMVKDTIKLILRSFNNECDYCVDHVKFNNIELNTRRINSSFDILNKLGNVMQISISSEYRDLKLDELHLSHEYQVKKQEEKEEVRRLKEEQREQQKLDKELKEAREKVEKERKHFSKEILNLRDKLNSTLDESDIQIFKSKILDLESKVAELDKEEKLIDYRENNAKAGYVYVISNIGAFGDDVYKIGMTRRLDPMERVFELSDASVPFPFDVHTLIFSENAPELESKIQNHFHNRRLNKINIRREFFRANPDEIEDVIREYFDKTIDFIKIPPAEQYRESQKL